MAISLSEQLEEVQTAISRLLADGQSWDRGERSRNEAQLEQLQAREEYLERKIARAARGGGIRMRRAVPRGT